MHVYSLTKLGRKVVTGKEASTDELKVLHFVRDRGSVVDSELPGDDIYIARKLVKSGLLQELTT